MSQKHDLRNFTITPEAIQVNGLKDNCSPRSACNFSVGPRSYHVTGIEAQGGRLCRQDRKDPAVTVEILPSDNGQIVELKGPFTAADSIVYFTDSTVASVYGRAFVPDANCRLFLTRDKEDFHLTNSGKYLRTRWAARSCG